MTHQHTVSMTNHMAACCGATLGIRRPTLTPTKNREKCAPGLMQKRHTTHPSFSLAKANIEDGEGKGEGLP